MNQIGRVRIKRLSEKHPKGTAIKVVFLVGGFGASLYLKNAIVAACPDIQIIQPNDA